MLRYALQRHTTTPTSTPSTTATARPTTTAMPSTTPTPTPTDFPASFTPSQKGTPLLVDQNNFRYRIHDKNVDGTVATYRFVYDLIFAFFFSWLEMLCPDQYFVPMSCIVCLHVVHVQYTVVCVCPVLCGYDRYI